MILLENYLQNYYRCPFCVCPGFRKPDAAAETAAVAALCQVKVYEIYNQKSNEPSEEKNPFPLPKN